MRFTLRLKILLMVGIITLSSLLGYIVLTYNARVIGNRLQVETEDHIKAIVGKNAGEIESAMLLMERTADALATTGEAFYAIHKATAQDITEQIKGYLINTFKKVPKAIGGGLWYEPHALFEERERFGAYVYRENDQVFFTWDLNTEAYDYHRQAWYLLAIPEDWNRSQQRPSRIYWTDPYFDEAATKALMITVDALMHDLEGKVIGLSTVDFSLEGLKDMVARMTVTPNALPFAVDVSSGLLISFPSDPSKVLKNIADLGWGEKIEEIKNVRPGEVIATLATLQGKEFFLVYTVSSTGTALGILAPHDELYAHINELNRANMVTSLIIISIQVVLYLLIAFFMVRRICNPISRLTDVAQEIAAGNLAGASGSLAAIEAKNRSDKDETGQLLAAFQGMNRDLTALFGQVQRSGTQVSSSSAQIAASSKQMEATVSEQAAATHQVSVSSKQISATASTLANTVNEVTTSATETAGLAEAGQKGLEGMEQSMQGVLKGSESVSAKLEEIKENTLNISTIVSTMTRVADQTNLLSLNAAIEAEKAGEYGLGFSVVAREIRRLADQTSVAVLDIEDMVKRMEASVSDGAAEMETFSEDVRVAVSDINKIGRQLDGIMERVRSLPPRFESVNEGMETQSRSAGRISETMEQLNLTAQHTLKALREFNLSAEYLRDAAQILQDAVARFRVTE
ncbi:MAG: methyl-accepting chemotaxis protein [Deltaproteobacteria bacterium]|nr:methyl-accepting chemotaxis protein [Deltaproteobacteria bacterium]